jgi:hypothetical protein
MLSPEYNSEGVLNTNAKEVIAKYLKGWFFIDLIASIPYD